MQAIKSKSKELTLAGALLAIAALVAVVFTAASGAPTPAQAGNTSPFNEPATGANPQQQQTEPEACAATPAPVVSTGRYGLFDVYWDAGKKNLVSNPCPPALTHTTTTEEKSDGFGGTITTTTTTHTRSASDIDIGQTVIHIPGRHRVNLNDPNSEYPETRYGALWRLDANDDNDGIVWILPALPDGNDDSLTVSFTASLLNPNDWRDAAGSSDPGPVQFEFEAVSEPDVNPDDRGHVLVYDTDVKAPNLPAVEWDTLDPDENELQVAPGEYEHRMWAFTRPGTYVFEVHAKGHPSKAFSKANDLSDDREADVTLTSQVRRYTFHVGLMADLGVAVTAEPAPSAGSELSPGEEVIYRVTASNTGPDTATNTTLDVTLPDGLIHVTPAPATGTYDAANGVWTVGDLASGASAILNIAAQVDEDTHGIPQTATAEIYAVETVGGTDRRELDPRLANNTAQASVTPMAEPNVAPMFQYKKSVAEKEAAGTLVGDPIMVREPNVNDTMTFSLVGDGSDAFDVTLVDGAAQIIVATGAMIDYQQRQSYDLVLRVSDGRDRHGNTDTRVDDRAAVRIDIVNDPNDDPTPTVTLTSDSFGSQPVNSNVLLTWTITDMPVGASAVSLHYEVVSVAGQSHQLVEEGVLTDSVWTVTSDTAETRAYRIERRYSLDGEVHIVDSEPVLIEWTAGN